MQFVANLGILALGSRLRGLSERLYAIADEVYAAYGIDLHARYFPVLRLLHDRGPRSIGEIAEAIGQTHSAVSQLATKLLREGWVEAASDPGDRRVRRLGLSPKAALALREAKPLWRALEQLLGERCDAAGLDVMPMLQTLGTQVLDDTMGPAVIDRARHLRGEAVRIVPFAPALREHFYRLNADWLQRYFYLEEIDHRVLSDPEGEIIAPGGAVVFARQGDEIVGTCALMQAGPGVYELTKMAVDPAAQGLGIGRLLIMEMIAEFTRRGGKRLFLETNSRLVPAIMLYESTGFIHEPAPAAASHYQRADTYMVYAPE